MNFFQKEPKSKTFFFGGGGGVGWGEGGGWVEGEMDEQTNKPKPICTFNFFRGWSGLCDDAG